ncbi:hypothetical protein C5167_028881 [Papaver somniferum]|nr:hypothetical protein C5167_028881 [Papaver somniferum]
MLLVSFLLVRKGVLLRRLLILKRIQDSSLEYWLRIILRHLG